MRIVKPTWSNSFFGWLGYEAIKPAEDCVPLIRSAMLLALKHDGDCEHETLIHRIRQATEVVDLWYARPELMHAIALRLGEEKAREHLEVISALFPRFRRDGQMELRSRPQRSPLGPRVIH